MTVELDYDARQLDVVTDALSRYGEVIAPLVQGGFSKSIFDYRNKVWPSHAQSRIKTTGRRGAIGSKWFFRVDVPKSDQAVRRVAEAGGRMHSISKAGVLLEEGGLVRPRGKYLAIPTDSKLVRTATGKIKSRFKAGPKGRSFQFRGKTRAGGVPSSWQTFVRKPKRGPLTMYAKQGGAKSRKGRRPGRPRGAATGTGKTNDQGSVEAIFWLVPRALHTPKLKFDVGVRAYRPIVERNVKKKIEQGLRRALSSSGSRRKS